MPKDFFAGSVNQTTEGTDRKKNTRVICRTGDGLELEAVLTRLSRHTAAFEIAASDLLLQASEVLAEFRIVTEERTLYSGGAVIHSLVDFGVVLVCEAQLEPGGWRDVVAETTEQNQRTVASGFRDFLREWEGFYQILPEFKLLIADLESFLDALRKWLEPVEAGIRALPAERRVAAELEAVRDLTAAASAAIGAMFERFEFVAATVPEDLVPAHQVFCRQKLHPLLLCCPFMHRIFTKPLGYAGDYEMINMIVRNAPEGGSLLARLLQCYILSQAPAVAVRNRVDYFVKKFVAETDRVAAAGDCATICSIGCGPAREVERFMIEHRISNQAQFRLLDFNDETLNYTGTRLKLVRREHQRSTSIQLVKKAAQLLLKEKANSGLGEERYDLIYCSGLYDYLNDRVIRALNARLYDRLKPGGALIVTNFDPYNPIRRIMEFIFDWFLIHRDGKQLAALAPAQSVREHSVVRAEHSGCNIFLETRKPR